MNYKVSHGAHIANIKKNQCFLTSKSKYHFLCASKSPNEAKLFIAKVIAKVIARDIPKLKGIDSIVHSYFNRINIENYLDIIILLVPLITQNLQEDLCNVIKLTRSSDSINLAAINAIFILNRADFEFRNIDFSRINISGANLSESFFFNVNFEGSNLKAVNFTQSKLSNCNFRNCDFRDAVFSNFIFFGKHKKFIKIVKISKNDELLLAYSEKCANLWNLKKKTFLKTLYIDIRDAEFSPCGNFIAFICDNFSLWIWDIKNKVKPQKVHEKISNIAFSPYENI
ncbi:unnamed protein product [Blepharisma stoltei]|uniref:Pentapeptide repeat-containing protein n=1 Tax=Blepharisma stoltei TaxID=1481888 RepID=A0AAU9J989_9CILI|nr:unnamed protein product [Blepharisma stoltei]